VRRWFAGGPSEGSPGWNVRILLFARAQIQYLFPASIEHPDKNVPSDAGLVTLWLVKLVERTGPLYSYVREQVTPVG